MRGGSLRAVALLLGLGVSAALACGGGDFSIPLLEDRAGTLTAAPANNFAFEAMRLAPAPTDALRAVEPGPLPWSNLPERVAAIEVEGLTAEQANILRHMRGAGDREAADERGAGMPVAIRLYTAGAVDFLAKRPAPAATRFEAVLALAEAERRPRAVWAAYMLGRIHALAGEMDHAADAFARARTLALAGAEDPLGLAVDSYGEEARLHLDRAMQRLEEDELPAAATADFARDIAASVTLYAEQAARGSNCGVQSLRIVAIRLLRRPATLGALVAYPIVQRLLVAYSMALLEDQSDAPPASDILFSLATALERQGIERMASADRLAAFAYSSGRYDLAASLADRATGPLATWVRAKLALQSGDLPKTAALYVEALQAADGADHQGILEPSSRARLAGESAVLMLARGQFADALQRVFAIWAPYTPVVSHLARRVVTLDELKTFVDTAAPERPRPSPSQSDAAAPPYEVADAVDQLRGLLGQRLMRAGRFEEAPVYLAAGTLREAALAYGQAMHRADKAWSSVGRAHAWFAAAEIMRNSGDAMMGVYGYQSSPELKPIDSAFMLDAERMRVLASIEPPGSGWFAYGWAVQHAERAAALLPPRSQAFAAVLCHAARWMRRGHDDDRARELYLRYLRQGAYVPWGKQFGRDCPAPDFAAAENFTRQQMWRETRGFLSRQRWPIALAAVGVLGAISWRVRRRWGATHA